ncbi:hypothetical protein CBG55_06720 [Prevotella intermedia]|uniref:Uncharacterized protein n=1 Tax=Prevotella intermedia TaxID=28131 RepID=A0A2M8TPB6_PREIN|nr:hypothetical protein CBG55_06720 [Prevotella intermedia]PJI25763.1 hypothetical protein CTM59_06785 [Prevotella intermedia]
MCNYFVINVLQNLLFCIPKAAVLHGKSVGFALQKSRFRNVKAQLSLFNRIIFTKAKPFLCKTTLCALRICGRVVGAQFITFLLSTLLFFGVRNVTNHDLTHIKHSFSMYLSPCHKWQNEIRFPKNETLLKPLCLSKTLFTDAYK